jgi:cytochrome P450
MERAMTAVDLRWDPFDLDIWQNPYPYYERLREEAPVYYNEQYDFYAFSRFDDVETGLGDWQNFSSRHGNIYEFIKAGVVIPSGTLLMEDPPSHDIHRALLVRVFTPRRVAALEPKIREFVARQLDPLRDADGFDVAQVLSDKVPMSVIGMLLGIPEDAHRAIRDRTTGNLKPGEDGQMDIEQAGKLDGELFADYVDWRIKNPSDDLMTELLNATFEDENGVTRTLTRDEVLTYISVVAGAGNETTGQLMTWIGALFAKYPEQYQAVQQNPDLIDSALEEILRFEPTGHSIARYVANDVEYHGVKVPAGSTALFLIGSANHDPRKYPDHDVFDVTRKITQQRTFGVGLHYCMGAALARLEGQVTMDELLKRYPKGWQVDWDQAELIKTTTVRGWEKLPITINK